MSLITKARILNANIEAIGINDNISPFAKLILKIPLWITLHTGRPIITPKLLQRKNEPKDFSTVRASPCTFPFGGGLSLGRHLCAVAKNITELIKKVVRQIIKSIVKSVSLTGASDLSARTTGC